MDSTSVTPTAPESAAASSQELPPLPPARRPIAWPELPCELVSQILSHLPLPLICRLRCLCKSLSSFPSQPLLLHSLRSRHGAHLNPPTSFLYYRPSCPSSSSQLIYIDCHCPQSTIKAYTLPLDFLHVNYGLTLHSSSGGLLLLSNQHSFTREFGPISFVVCNPITRQWRELPLSPSIKEISCADMDTDLSKGTYTIAVATWTGTDRSQGMIHVYRSAEGTWMEWSHEEEEKMKRLLSIAVIGERLCMLQGPENGGFVLELKDMVLGTVRKVESLGVWWMINSLGKSHDGLLVVGRKVRDGPIDVWKGSCDSDSWHSIGSVAEPDRLHTFGADHTEEVAYAERAGMAMVEAYNLLPNLNVLVPSLLRDGIQAVFRVNVSPGIPVKPMLAKIKNGIPDLFKIFLGKAFTCEYKYDGQRAQVHVKKDGSIKIFSRNCEETTTRFPDVVSIVREGLKPDVDDLILDAEIVAVDREMGNKLLPFQHLSTRERGRIGSVISVENIKVDVCIFIFDLMFVNGKALVKKSFRERRRWMHDSIMDAQAGRFGFASEITIEAAEANVENSNAVSRIEAFLDEAISSSCEGIMVKALDEESAYIPSKRSDSWLKIKRDYIEGLHDTLDLVPIGAWYGNGRKAGWYSPFLVACYDPDREEFQSVCRVMSGFTDSFYKQMKEFYSGDRILQRKPTYYQTLEEPDVWFLSELVWEIRGADFTISPVHQAALGLVHSSRGISLRFPRFIKDRSDKKPEEASSPVEIADLYHQQSRKLDIAGHNMVKQDEETSQ